MISVCIATYNGGIYIKKQIDSIICQLSADDEIVVSDDGSKDDTLEILKGYNDPRIKIYKNEGRHGFVPNFENALRHAEGDYIFLADQDDMWAPNKVATCTRLLQEYDMVCHNALLMDENDKVSDVEFFNLRNSKEGFWTNVYKNRFIGCCCCFRKVILERALPFPRHILWHDMWIGLVAEKHGKVCFCKEPLHYYRRHGANASPTAEKSTFSVWKQIKYRLQMLWYVTFR